MSKSRIFILFFLLSSFWRQINAHFITLDILQNPVNNSKICLCGDYHSALETDNKEITVQQKHWIETEIQLANPAYPIYLLFEGKFHHKFKELPDTTSIIKQIDFKKLKKSMNFDQSQFLAINIENRPLCFVYAEAFFMPKAIPQIEGFPPNKVLDLVLPNLFDFSYHKLCSSFEKLFTKLFTKYFAMVDKLETDKREQFKHLLSNIQEHYNALRQYVSECEPQLEIEDCLLMYSSKLCFESIIESCKSYNIDLNQRMMAHTPRPITLLNSFSNLRFDIYDQLEWESVVSQQLHPFLRIIRDCAESNNQDKTLNKFFDRNERRKNLFEKINACFTGFIDANIFLKIETIQAKSPRSTIIVMAGLDHPKIVTKMLLDCGYKYLYPIKHNAESLTQQDFHTIFNIEAL